MKLDYCVYVVIENHQTMIEHILKDKPVIMSIGLRQKGPRQTGQYLLAMAQHPYAYDKQGNIHGLKTDMQTSIDQDKKANIHGSVTNKSISMTQDKSPRPKMSPPSMGLRQRGKHT